MLKIGLGIVRTKAMALLLGPAGVGLLGLYGTIADLAQTIAGMGINTSGVRQIAEAVGHGRHAVHRAHGDDPPAGGFDPWGLGGVAAAGFLPTGCAPFFWG